MKKNKTVIIVVILIGLIILGNNTIKYLTVNKKQDLIKNERFEKDEYCRRTYSDSFVKNYEKKLIGERKDEKEYIKLLEMFYSPSRNECMAVYNYYYFYFKNVDFNIFEKRIATSINADNIINTFQLTPGGHFDKYEEQSAYNEVLKDLKE